jgi:predicted RNase H-like nuclease (RuvC/YqgF family)
MAENDDLYGDLENAVAKKNTSTISAPNELKNVEPSKLQQEMDHLKTENETLKRNMGILYRTAKAELERKDRTIESLQSELDTLKR